MENFSLSFFVSLDGVVIRWALIGNDSYEERSRQPTQKKLITRRLTSISRLEEGLWENVRGLWDSDGFFQHKTWQLGKRKEDV